MTLTDTTTPTIADIDQALTHHRLTALAYDWDWIDRLLDARIERTRQ